MHVNTSVREINVTKITQIFKLDRKAFPIIVWFDLSQQIIKLENVVEGHYTYRASGLRAATYELMGFRTSVALPNKLYIAENK